MMKMFDIDKLAHSITHPFHEILGEFTGQMKVLQTQMEEANSLNTEMRDLLQEIRDKA